MTHGTWLIFQDMGETRLAWVFDYHAFTWVKIQVPLIDWTFSGMPNKPLPKGLSGQSLHKSIFWSGEFHQLTWRSLSQQASEMCFVQQIIERWCVLVYRETLANVFLLIDASVPTQALDLACANWLVDSQVPLSIIFTKTDKRKKRTAPVEDNIDSFMVCKGSDWSSSC